MIHDSSLSTVALLSAYTESHERHYLDLLIPFVEYCLPKEEGSVIQFAAVRSMLESEFGIAGTPEKIIKAILKRYNRKYPEAVVVDTSGNYLVRKVRDNSEFNQRRDLIRIQMQDVVRKFSSFLDSYAGFKETKSAKEMLLHFFEAYGLTLVDKVEDLIAVEAVNKEMFIVSKFILWANKNDSSLFASLVELTKGFLTYRAIYQIDSEEKTDAQSKLRGVACYLDCSLLISLLGYDTEESKSTVQNLLTIIQKNGGTVRVFTHTVDEAKRLLLSYADSDNKLRYRLPGLKQRREPDSAIRAQALRLEESIRQLGLNITVLAEDKLQQCSEALSTIRSFIFERHTYGKKPEYDFKSIVGIYDLRKNSHPMLIEQCKAILITQDLRLAYGIQRLRTNESHEISYAKLDSDIIALLWLQTFTACPNIPKDILLSNAAAAVTLSEEVRQRALELCDQWEKDGSMTPEMATLIRSDRLDEYMLADATLNDPDGMTIDVATALVKDYFRPEFSREKENEIDAEKRRFEKELKKAKEEYAATIYKEKQAHSEALKENEINYEKEIQARERERQIQQSRKIDEMADKISGRIETAAKWAIVVVVLFLCTILSVAQIKGIIASNKVGNKDTLKNWIILIGSILVGVYGTVSPFICSERLIRRLLKKMRLSLYMKIRRTLSTMNQKFQA